MEESKDDIQIPGNLFTIFMVSVLGLFIELLFIRWIGTEIRIFVYLQNTVLVVCFMGLGMGCWTAKKPILLGRMLLFLFLLVALISHPESRPILHTISDNLSVLGGQLMWSSINADESFPVTKSVLFGLAGIFTILFLIWQIFIPLGRILGRALDEHNNTIVAYSINIAGSLIGIWLFVLISAFHQPPFVWFLVVAGLILLMCHKELVKKPHYLLLLSIIVLLPISAGDENNGDVVWSSYQKLILTKTGEDFEPPNYYLSVNNTGYQLLLNLSEEHVNANPDLFPEETRSLSQYDIPPLLHPNPKSMLFVGAGAGNDVAGGLRHGGEKITGVEIDAAIVEFGKKYHPEQPYSSPKVTIVVDDARSFFARSKEKFDLIVFGLLDSHTTGAMTNARLDHFVYTKESIEQAKALLNEGGVMVLSFEPQKKYIADRIGRVLTEVFEERPMYFRAPHNQSGWGGMMFVSGDQFNIRNQLSTNQRLSQLIDKWKSETYSLSFTTNIVTDDWPYLYLVKPNIPVLFFIIAAALAVFFLFCSINMGTLHLLKEWNTAHWHFFFMGAGFLLLEVQNISKASGLFGNTWLVNSIMISGIFGMILIANLLVTYYPKVRGAPVYACLIGSCFALFFVDIAQFSSLPFVTRAIVVSTIFSIPLLFSGIIFMSSFAAVKQKDLALGANLFGALIGGMLQSITFLTGMKALLLIVALFYLAALLMLHKSKELQNA